MKLRVILRSQNLDSKKSLEFKMNGLDLLGYVESIDSGESESFILNSENFFCPNYVTVMFSSLYSW